MKRVNIKVSKSVHAKLCLLAEKKKTSLNGTIAFLLRKDASINKLELENEKLKQQLGSFKTVHKETSAIADKYLTFIEKYPCLARYEENGEFYCVNQRAKSMVINTLKICKACRWRINEDTPEWKLKKKVFVTCGAREHYDKKKGLMLYCSKHFQGQWITPQNCKDAKCPYVKEVQTT